MASLRRLQSANFNSKVISFEGVCGLVRCVKGLDGASLNFVLLCSLVSYFVLLCSCLVRKLRKKGREKKRLMIRPKTLYLCVEAEGGIKANS